LKFWVATFINGVERRKVEKSAIKSTGLEKKIVIVMDEDRRGLVMSSMKMATH